MLENAEHGLLLDESIDVNYFLDNLPTSDGKVVLAPKKSQARLAELLGKSIVREDISDFPLQLINRRRKHMMNSWLTQGAMQKMPKREGGIVEINPDDAASFGLNDGDTVCVASNVAEVEAKLIINDEVRRGVAVMAGVGVPLILKTQVIIKPQRVLIVICWCRRQCRKWILFRVFLNLMVLRFESREREASFLCGLLPLS